MMKINRQLNLVLPVQTENSGTVYIHSSAIGLEVFEQFYSELGKVFAQCFDGAGSAALMIGAPQLAYAALKSISKKSGTWDGADGVKFGLVNEIVRLTNIVGAGGHGWQSTPLAGSVEIGILTEEEEAEVLSSLIFFTAISKVAPKDLRVTLLEMMSQLRNWEIISLGCTEYVNSLVTLTSSENIGETRMVSSVIA
jgi:hypothetical protein